MKNNIEIYPPWITWPGESRYSMGWRMGWGESDMSDFSEYFNSLSILEKENYINKFPEPNFGFWRGFYKSKDECPSYSSDHIIIELFNNEIYYNHDLKNIPKNEIERDHLFLFYGHNQKNNQELDRSCFSQWYITKFEVDSEIYTSMEQYMMAMKALLFNDLVIHEKIMQTPHPNIIKKLGREVRDFNNSIWEKYSRQIVINGNYAKFTSSKILRNFLLSTDNKIIVEANPYDNIWGAGLNIDNQRIYNPKNWKGKNHLGFALMEVRDEIRRVYKNVNGD